MASASTSRSTSRDVAYDEERCRRRSDPRWSWPRTLVPRKVSLYLFLIDFVIISTLLYIFAPLITLLVRNEELFGARLTFDGKGSQEEPPRQTIPRILHQTTANETIPKQWEGPQQACRDAYSDFDYKVRSTNHQFACLC